MGIRDWFSKGKQAAADNKEAVKDGIENTGDMVDDKTGGEFSEQVDQGQDMAKDFVDDLPED
jgi:MT0933-like antitoxin protein